MNAKKYYERLINLEEDIFKEITRFSEEENRKYQELLNYLKNVNDNRNSYTHNEKGKALENIVSFLLEKTVVFTVKKNIYTSSNEIDQLVGFSFKGKKFKQYIDIRGDNFIGECKNYKNSIGASWVGKVFSLLQYTSCNLGVIFSYFGLSGTGWNDGIGLTKKLFLAREDHSKKIYILDFNIKDFEHIANGVGFIDLLENKMTALRTDTNYANYISSHPIEESSNFNSN